MGKRVIKVYDRSQDGMATAILEDGEGNASILMRKPSITQIRKHLPEFKKSNGLNRIPIVHTYLGVPYQHDYSDICYLDGTKPESEKKKFSIDERFNMVESVVKMIIDGYQNSLILSGSGGVGKTYSVLETFDKAGWKRLYPNDPSPVDNRKFYRHFRGGASPTELYKAFHDFNGETLVFDDFDSIFKEPASVNLLKAALDSYERREITWISPVIERQGFPTSFEFEGKVVFISNLKFDKIPQAVQSRSLLLSLDFAPKDIVARMRTIGPKMVPELEENQLKEAINWIDENKGDIKDLSLRTLLKVSRFIYAGLDNWKDLSEYAN